MVCHEQVSKSFFCTYCRSEFTIVHPSDLNEEVYWCPFCSSEDIMTYSGDNNDILGGTK